MKTDIHYCAAMRRALTLLLLSTFALRASVDGQPAVTDRILYSCNFESGICSMSVIPDSSGFTWTLLAGPTPSDPTGPDVDHTYMNATGHYMYTEATDFQPGEIAKLQLPPLTFSPPSSQGALCLTFWRHMYGIHIGTLNVTQMYVGQNAQTVWSLSGNQSNVWIQTNVTLRPDPSSSSSSYGSVTFVGVRGGADIGQPFGDIAIDDVIVYDGSCGVDTTTAASATTTQTTTAATTTMATTPAVTSSSVLPIYSATTISAVIVRLLWDLFQ